MVFIALAGIAVLVYSVILILLYSFQEKMIFAPTILPQNYRFEFPSPFAERFDEINGERVNSLLFRANSSQGLILYFHGNRGSLENWGKVACELSQRLGWDVWVMDYPGYGKSTGKIRSEKQILKMCQDFYELARQEYAAESKIVILGRSIGSGFAVKVACDNPVAGLILETPYFSLKSLAQGMFPWVLPFVLRYSVHSDRWITSVKCPILILHGSADQVIPFAEGKNLSQLVPQAQFIEMQQGRHADLASFPAYWPALESYLHSVRTIVHF